jgi:type I restriction enzyme S subunit
MTTAYLGEIAEVISGQHLVDGEHNLQRRGVGYLTGPADFGLLQPTVSRWTETPKALCEPGDVLITVKGAGVGKVNMAPNTTTAIGRQLMAVRANKNHVVGSFLFAFLKAQITYFQYKAVGATVPGLSRDDLLNLIIPLPSLPDQHSIANSLKNQLAQVDVARQASQEQLDGVKGLLAAVYRDAFANVLPVAVPPVLAAPPSGWQWRRLTDVARLESGHTPSRSRPDWWGGDVSWISLTEIRALDGQWVESTQLRTNAAGIANSAARILPRGTVCYSRTASVGFVAIMAKPMATSQDFANWVCGDALDPEFLMHALIRARKELRDLATGATHKTIYMPTLESFHICAPDIDTQRRIVRDLKQRLAEASKLRAALAAQQAELTKLPQRLLAKAFEN